MARGPTQPPEGICAFQCTHTWRTVDIAGEFAGGIQMEAVFPMLKAS
jgi:hypothetical protein